AREAGALGAVLSGSGPSLLALCDGSTEEVAVAMRSAWTAAGVESVIHCLELASAGARIA
ncbi:MAG: homoserine kinase, partial [Armatimonadetes bacterium]|nr:homoserine kinase [Armatimonadota bacterium]